LGRRLSHSFSFSPSSWPTAFTRRNPLYTGLSVILLSTPRAVLVLEGDGEEALASSASPAPAAALWWSQLAASLLISPAVLPALPPPASLLATLWPGPAPPPHATLGLTPITDGADAAWAASAYARLVRAACGDQGRSGGPSADFEPVALPPPPVSPPRRWRRRPPPRTGGNAFGSVLQGLTVVPVPSEAVALPPWASNASVLAPLLPPGAASVALLPPPPPRPWPTLLHALLACGEDEHEPAWVPAEVAVRPAGNASDGPPFCFSLTLRSLCGLSPAALPPPAPPSEATAALLASLTAIGVRRDGGACLAPRPAGLAAWEEAAEKSEGDAPQKWTPRLLDPPQARPPAAAHVRLNPSLKLTRAPLPPQSRASRAALMANHPTLDSLVKLELALGRTVRPLPGPPSDGRAGRPPASLLLVAATSAHAHLAASLRPYPLTGIEVRLGWSVASGACVRAASVAVRRLVAPRVAGGDDAPCCSVTAAATARRAAVLAAAVAGSPAVPGPPPGRGGGMGGGPVAGVAPPPPPQPPTRPLLRATGVFATAAASSFGGGGGGGGDDATWLAIALSGRATGGGAATGAAAAAAAAAAAVAPPPPPVPRPLNLTTVSLSPPLRRLVRLLADASRSAAAGAGGVPAAVTDGGRLDLTALAAAAAEAEAARGPAAPLLTTAALAGRAAADAASHGPVLAHARLDAALRAAPSAVRACLAGSGAVSALGAAAAGAAAFHPAACALRSALLGHAAMAHAGSTPTALVAADAHALYGLIPAVASAGMVPCQVSVDAAPVAGLGARVAGAVAAAAARGATCMLLPRPLLSAAGVDPAFPWTAFSLVVDYAPAGAGGEGGVGQEERVRAALASAPAGVEVFAVRVDQADLEGAPAPQPPPPRPPQPTRGGTSKPTASVPSPPRGDDLSDAVSLGLGSLPWEEEEDEVGSGSGGRRPGRAVRWETAPPRHHARGGGTARTPSPLQDFDRLMTAAAGRWASPPASRRRASDEAGWEEEGEEPWARPRASPPPPPPAPYHTHTVALPHFCGGRSVSGGFMLGFRGGGGHGGDPRPATATLDGEGSGGEAGEARGGGGGREPLWRPPPPAQQHRPPHPPAPAIPTTSSALREEAHAALARWGGGRGRRGRVAKPVHAPGGRPADTPTPRDGPGASRPPRRNTPPPTGKNAFWAWRRRRAEREG